MLFPGVVLAADGSLTNNPDLLRGSYDMGCGAGWPCPPVSPQQPPARSASLPQHAPAAPVSPGVPLCARPDPGAPHMLECDPQPVTKAVAAPPPAVKAAGPPVVYTPYAPPTEAGGKWFDPQWSVALRGGYTKGANGGSFDVRAIPSLSLVRESAGWGWRLDTDATIILEQGGSLRIGGANAALSGNRQIGGGLKIDGSASASLSQDSASAPGTAANIVQQPLVFSGEIEGGIARDIGRFTFEARGGIERQIYGPTSLTGGGVTDNTERNRTSGTGSLRAGLGLSRSLGVFAEGRLTRDVYDTASTGLGVKLDGWTAAILGGVSFSWRNVEAEIAAGYGLRFFDAATLANRGAFVTSAAITVNPAERLSLTARAGTEFVAPESGSATAVEVDYIASLAATYRVNGQIGLRSSLGGQWNDRDGASPDGWSLNAGLGLDYALTRQMSLTADYFYEAAQDQGAALEQSHGVSLGVRYSR